MTKVIDPAAFDAAEHALIGQAGRIESRMDTVWDDVHRAAGDKSRYAGRRRAWQMKDGDALAIVKRIAGVQRLSSLPLQSRAGTGARNIISTLDSLHDQLTALQAQIGEQEAVYRQGPWTRYFPCLNADGHIHSSLRDCPTVRRDTMMGWETSLSGKTVAECIEALGPRLCSVCFPDAPAEHCRSLSDITRAAREAEAAARKNARDAKRLVRELSGGEVFRDFYGHPVTTVSRCKEIIRDEVEGRDRWGQGPSRFRLEMVQDASRAATVLIARETAAPGTGMTREAIDTMIANAVKRNRKEGARLGEDGQPLR